ncbi:M20 peptidase aminoacylase family protein [Scopulibacillus darangshiensis]|nr:M20 peptidase aminoacylase family protein [Scopulibacillus darangshiensis]
MTIDAIKPKVKEIFDHLHSHPEVSWHEDKTTAYIANILKENGCRVTKFDDCTGVVGEIGQGKPIVAVRADIDALWQEVDGVFQGNHSCGHDAHMSMVLGVLFTLKNMRQLPKGTIRFIFQPAEEKGAGALKMVEKGVAEDIDFLYGVHLRPIQETANGRAAPAIVHGASGTMNGEIHGEEAHGARPHLGTNAVEIGATLVHELGHIHLNPMIPHSVKMTKLWAGGDSANIIPGHASFSIDLRAQTNEIMALLIEQVENVVQTTADFYKVKIELSKPSHIAAAKVHYEAQRYMADAITEILGKDHLDEPLVTPGGDDFHFYTLKRPSIKATMLGLGCDLAPGLHHPQMTFDRDALFSGIQILTTAILNTLEQEV